MDAQTFEELATMLGTRAAGEVLLLAVARACKHTPSLWNQAHSVGIPWQRKKWTALSTLIKQYNSGVETALPAVLEKGEDWRRGRQRRHVGVVRWRRRRELCSV